MLGNNWIVFSGNTKQQGKFHFNYYLLSRVLVKPSSDRIILNGISQDCCLHYHYCKSDIFSCITFDECHRSANPEVKIPLVCLFTKIRFIPFFIFRLLRFSHFVEPKSISCVWYSCAAIAWEFCQYKQKQQQHQQQIIVCKFQYMFSLVHT